MGRVHQVIGRVRVMIQVRVEWCLPMSSCAVHGMVIVHVICHWVHKSVVMIVELLLLLMHE